MKQIFLVSTVALLSMSATSSLKSQEAVPQPGHQIFHIQEGSIRNPNFVPGPASIAQPNEFLDYLSVPAELPPDLSQELSMPNMPSLDLVDLGIRNLSEKPDEALAGALSEMADRLEETPEDWIRRGIIKQFVNGDSLAATDSYFKAAEAGSSLAALFSGRAYCPSSEFLGPRAA